MTGFQERMRASAAKTGSRVVLALDLSGPHETRLERAEAVLDATRGMVAAVKLNHHLMLPFGLGGLEPVLSACRRDGVPVIADLKANDIEATNLNILETLLAYGVDALIANPFVGFEEGLGKVIEQAHSRGAGVILLVYMSHRGAPEGYGLKTDSGEPLYRVFARRARDWRADGVVVSAKSAGMISETRGIVGSSCLIFSPGVGAQGGTTEGAAGADFLIVGRAVTEAEDPASALKAFTG